MARKPREREPTPEEEVRRKAEYEAFMFRPEVQQLILRVLNYRLRRYKNNVEDAYQEVLLRVWRAWRSGYIEGVEPTGLMLTCARNVGKELYLKNERRLRRIKSVDDETLTIMSESWSEREDYETTRKREPPPVQKRPWIEYMDVGDRAIASLCEAIARSGFASRGGGPGHIWHVVRVTRAHGIDRTALSRWQHRCDNARNAWAKGIVIKPNERGDGRDIVRTWGAGPSQREIAAAARGELPVLTREDAPLELAEWIQWNRTLGEGILSLKRFYNSRSRADHGLPPEVLHGDPYDACLWMRKWNAVIVQAQSDEWRNWPGLSGSLKAFGRGLGDPVADLAPGKLARARRAGHGDVVVRPCRLSR